MLGVSYWLLLICCCVYYYWVGSRLGSDAVEASEQADIDRLVVSVC